MMTKRVCIVGAGVAGLAAIKSCLEDGLTPVCYEQSADIGGLWNYSDDVKEGEPSLYRSCVINTSKEMTCYSDFPIPEDYPNFMSHRNFKRYLDLYTDTFKLRKYVSFCHRVQSIKKSSKIDNGLWYVTVLDLKTGQRREETVDFVLVCNGHLHEPNVPNVKGLETFQGRVLHTYDYKDFRGFEDKNVLVLGIGNSAADVACELSRHAKHVYVSTRRGTYVIQRAGDFGHPFDMAAIQRWVQKLPRSLMRPYHFHKINRKYRHARYGLAPNFRFEGGAVTISDDLPNRILVGAISVHDNVDHFTATSAVLEDGTTIRDLDCVVLGTGYTYSFPFLDAETVKVEKKFPRLYQLVFPPDMPCTLAVIGLVQPFGALPPVLEMQARAATAVFSGKSRLPSPEDMEQWLELRQQFIKAKYVDSPRFNIQIYFIQYLDELSSMIGCKPQLWKYFLTNPKLWYKLVFGPATPSQWRLEGPNKWPGAETAIMTVEARTYFPMKTRQAGVAETEGLYDGWLHLLALLAGLVFGLLLLRLCLA